MNRHDNGPILAFFDAIRAQLAGALDILGGRQTRAFGFVDRETWLNFAALTHAVETVLRELHPRRIFTHPYEGGHPDHDSVALAVSQARQRFGCTGARREGAFYHRRNNELQTGEFLPAAEPVMEQHLSPGLLAQETAMLNCFASQQAALSLFKPAIERYRPAPAYDFTAPPHPGTLHYETFCKTVTGESWREAARTALLE